MPSYLCLRLLAVFFFTSQIVSAQIGKPYFQQRTDYIIEVTLDDKNHELSAYEEITYTNNSRVPLDSIYFHLWPNAYKNNETDFARQLLENGNTSFYYSLEEEKGYIDSLDFRVNKKKVNWHFDPNHIDICIVKLNEPLPPGNSIKITTPFHVKLPGDFSRMGHDGESYQVTQWYPKPAVFDKDGWHPMPYLDQGEFYSEYGSFQVTINLPKNYVVGATGDLQNQEEINWLNQKVKDTERISVFPERDSFPESSSEFKSLTYIQSRVHDFAWFADKRYHVLKGRVELPDSKDSVDTWVMFTNTEAEYWKDAIPYMNRAIYSYSLWNGNYPYKQATAVYGALSAGGGMEYPNVTVIGQSGSPEALELVIVHEVGHNWFQGILGFNERDHPAMDEGINSFNELRYVETYMKDYSIVSSYLSPLISRWMNLEGYTHKDENYLFNLYSARKNRDQPLNLKSDEYTSTNYGGIVYAKKAISVQMLRAYLGDSLFDKGMQKFYEKWKFKHPSITDWQQIMQEETEKNLDWFFGGYYKTTDRIDLKIKKVKKKNGQLELTVKNKGDVSVPFSVTTYSKKEKLKTYNYEFLPLDKEVISIKNENAKRVVLDGEKNLVEHNRKNNTIRTHGILKKMEPLQVRLFTSNENPQKTQLYLTPLIGWNTADEFMLGIGLHNKSFIEKPFEWFVGPMYSFHREDFTGITDLSYHVYPNHFRRITFNVNAMRFSYNIPINGIMTYNRLYPKVIFEFKPSHERSKWRHGVNVGALYIEELYKGSGTPFISAYNTYGELGYNFTVTGYRQELRTKVKFTLHEDFDLAEFTSRYRLFYNERGNAFTARVFVGSFLYNETNSPIFNFRMDGQTGYLDYKKNQVFLDRAGTHDVWKNQMNENHGAFKSPTSVGQSSNWIAALNLKFEAPLVIPIGIYADLGVADKTDFMYNAGFSFRVLRDICEIYFPVLWSDNIKKSYDANATEYGERIRFTLNLPAVDPYKNISRLTF
ncbi:MAG: hypothetical protein CL840_16685 [Crocinitomicaceae bacterium]|nr:hypothetical protein [Crocinitomicaceae bacterium]|tara:strand:- start:3529 stop:6498 length:2970 start_codon:yes stop_codon:yes gene_type:complete